MRMRALHVSLATGRWWWPTEKAVCNGGEVLMAVSDTMARFLHLGEMRNRVRRRPIRSKEDKGAREVELTESGVWRQRWLHIWRGRAISGGRGWTKGVMEDEEGGGGAQGCKLVQGEEMAREGCSEISCTRGREIEPRGEGLMRGIVGGGNR
jgi:hypothetical protein